MIIELSLSDSDLDGLGVFSAQTLKKGWQVDIDRDLRTRSDIYRFSRDERSDVLFPEVDYMDVVHTQRGGEALGNGLFTRIYSIYKFGVRGTGIVENTVEACLTSYRLYKEGIGTQALHNDSSIREVRDYLHERAKPRRKVILGGGHSDG